MSKSPATTSTKFTKKAVGQSESKSISSGIRALQHSGSQGRRPPMATAKSHSWGTATTTAKSRCELQHYVCFVRYVRHNHSRDHRRNHSDPPSGMLSAPSAPHSRLGGGREVWASGGSSSDRLRLFLLALLRVSVGVSRQNLVTSVVNPVFGKKSMLI
ncbi:hypothetical protein NDU88_001287 [Pleurodeles waltl]|uniref:Uncharacterized protein n=1 Tax=Pleurodeles waltl TaxID=8319 RepID=A0AAV7WLH8_PLEWA|nr:hypothetical protein NDU88_001287 [Pleurodeles waltl]